MYKHLFFDFDGTLFNGYPRMLNALIKVFKAKRNVDISYDQLFFMAMESFRVLSEKMNMTQEEWDLYHIIMEEDDSLPSFEPFEGTKEMLEELHSLNVDCFIYTNRDEKTYYYLEKYGLKKYFKDYIINANKPSAEPLERMIEKYSLDKKDCLVVGDRELDLISSINSGIDSFSINDYKAERKCTFQGNNYKELLKIVKLSRIKGVVFDLDGVLINTVDLHYNAWKKVADDEGIYFDREINNELRGISRGASLEVILRRSNRTYSLEEKKELSDRKGIYYDIELESVNESSIPDEAKYVLKALKEKNIKISVGSSSVNASKILKKAGIYDWFDVVYDGTMITKAKPDPEVFLVTAKAMGLSPEECLVIEDATAGIDAANAASFVSVGISYVTEYNKTNVKIDSLKEILTLIDKINS